MVGAGRHGEGHLTDGGHGKDREKMLGAMPCVATPLGDHEGKKGEARATDGAQDEDLGKQESPDVVNDHQNGGDHLEGIAG